MNIYDGLQRCRKNFMERYWSKATKNRTLINLKACMNFAFYDGYMAGRRSVFRELRDEKKQG